MLIAGCIGLVITGFILGLTFSLKEINDLKGCVGYFRDAYFHEARIAEKQERLIELLLKGQEE